MHRGFDLVNKFWYLDNTIDNEECINTTHDGIHLVNRAYYTNRGLIVEASLLVTTQKWKCIRHLLYWLLCMEVRYGH